VPTRHVLVEQDQVSQVTTTESDFIKDFPTNDPADYYTIEQMFGELERLVNDAILSSSLVITYDETLGYPTSFSYQTQDNNRYEAKIEWMTHYLQLQADLYQAKSTWEAVNLTDYWYIAVPSCFCAPDHLRPKTVWVSDGMVQQVWITRTGLVHLEEKDYITMEGLFAAVQQAIDGRYMSIQVEYEPKYGHITTYSTDMVDGLADAGMGATVTAFDASGVKPSIIVDKRWHDFVTNQELFQAAGIKSCTYYYSRECRACPGSGGPWLVTVVDDKVVSVQSDDRATPDWDQEFTIPTYPEIFGIIEEALDADAFQVDVTYDPSHGYPVDVFIDLRQSTADEEFIVTTSLVSMDVRGDDEGREPGDTDPTTPPTSFPTAAPTVAPTSTPTMAPTSAPTASPTMAPTSMPTVDPLEDGARETVDETKKPKATKRRARGSAFAQLWFS